MRKLMHEIAEGGCALGCAAGLLAAFCGAFYGLIWFGWWAFGGNNVYPH